MKVAFPSFKISKFSEGGFLSNPPRKGRLQRSPVSPLPTPQFKIFSAVPENSIVLIYSLYSG